MRNICGVAFVLVVVVAAGCGSVAPKSDGGSVDDAADDDDAAIPRHTLTVTSSGNGAGSVTSTPAGINCGGQCSAEFDEGTLITLHATSEAGSTFVGWSGGTCTGTEECTFTVTSELTVQALFALNNSVVVTIAGNGVGTVVSSPNGIDCPGDCSEAYGPGQTITLTATAGTESVFTGWSGGACTGTGTCTVTSDAAVGIVATFALKQYTLTVTKGGNGAGTVTSNPAGISCGSTCTANYDSGTSITLVPTASTGSTFVGWSGGGCSGTGTCTVTMTTAKSVTATFTLNQYALTVTRDGNGAGTVTSNPNGINCGGTCAASFNYGQTVTLTAAPSTGSLFTGWSGGGCSGTSTCSVPISIATTVTATFTLTQHVLTVAKAGAGTGTVVSNPVGINCGADCSEAYNYGTSVTLTPSPAADSAFAGWSGACTGLGTCTLPMTTARNVTAPFVKKLSCNSLANIYACTNGAVPEIDLGQLTAAQCQDQCQSALAIAGVTSGCWIVAGSCYCRSGTTINTCNSQPPNPPCLIRPAGNCN